MWKWCNTYNILPVDNVEGRCQLPYYVLEDALFDLWSITELQNHSKLLTNNARLMNNSTSLTQASSPSTSGELQLSLRLQEISHISWAQLTLKKLVPLLQIREVIHRYDHQNHLNKIRQPRIEKQYYLDQDTFLQIMIDSSRRTLNKAVDELKHVWNRMLMAHSMHTSAARGDPNSRHPPVGVDSTQSGSGVVVDKVGLKLPDFLGFLRSETPWFEDLELWLMYYECIHSTSTDRSEDAVYMDGWIRIGIRYEMLNPPMVEVDGENDAVDASIHASMSNEQYASVKSNPNPVSTAHLHLTRHHLPFPCLCLPGYREVGKDAHGKNRSSKTESAIFSPNPSSSSSHFRPFKNVGGLVWDVLSAARQIPHPEKRSNEVGGGPVQSSSNINRPMSLCDASPHLPPSIIPPNKLTPIQSFKLLSALSALFHPLILHNLTRAQTAWQLSTNLSSSELQFRQSKLSHIYERLTELQMYLERARGNSNISIMTIKPNDDPTRLITNVSIPTPPISQQPTHDTDSLYETDSDDDVVDEDEHGDIDHESVNGLPGISSARSRSNRKSTSSTRRSGSILISRAELVTILHTSWNIFRQLLTDCTDLLIRHSALHQQLERLKATDGNSNHNDVDQ